MAAPVYINRLSSQGIGELQPSRNEAYQVTGQAVARFGQALGGLGNSVLGLSQQIEQINRSSKINDRKTQFLTEIDGLGKEFENDQDPATAEKRFQEKVQQLEGRALDGLQPDDQAELRVSLRRQSISYAGGVRSGALKKQADGYSANLDQQYDVLTKRYAQAQTDQERQAIAGELDATLQSGVGRGMITAKAGEAYKQSLVKTGDTALVLRRIGQDPAAAQAALADPQQYPGLDAVQREQLTAQARAAAEERAIAANTQRARFDPAGAAFAAGRVSSPDQVAAIFDKAFIPQESSGNPNAQSVDGAAGIAQIMPGTAKDLVKRMGIGNWDDLSDAEIQKRLKENPTQSKAMGIRYFQDNITRFNGNLAPAIAAYHAGPAGAVGKAHEQATAKYGATYSPEQFLEFLPDTLKDGNGKTTASYVRDIYGRMNAPLNAMGLSPMSSFRASNAVGAEIDRQLAEQRQMLSQLVAVSTQQVDQFAALYQKGYAVDPARVAAIQAPLELGAARGDANAAAALQRLAAAREVAPIVQEAYRMRPEQVEAGLAQMRQQMAANATPELAKRVQVFEAVASEMATARKDNPIALAERQGMPATVIDVQAAPGSPDLATAIARRSAVSDRAFAAYGGTQQFFRPEERTGLRARFEGMGEQERFEMLQTLQRNSTSEAAYRAAVSEITGGDKLAATAGMFMTSNPQLARDIIRGAGIAQLDGVKPKAEEVKRALKSTLPGTLYPPQVQSQLIDAALAVYANERGRNAALYDAADRAGLETALERVLGKTTKVNGKTTPVPAGHGIADMSDALSGLSEPTLDAFGGAYGFGGQKLAASHIGRHAQFTPVDANIGAHRQYMVELPTGNGQTRPVLDQKGQPLIVDLPRLIELERQNVRPGSRQEFTRGLAREGMRLMQPPPPAPGNEPPPPGGSP